MFWQACGEIAAQTVDGNIIGTFLKSKLAIAIKINYMLFWPRNSSTRNLQIVLELCQSTCIQMLCIALIIIGKLEKQPVNKEMPVNRELVK